MDLLSIIRAIWRHKLATIPVILLTAIGAFYVFAVKAPVYEASSSFLLLNPPAGPTPSQIAADPKLGKINTNNPYLNFDNLEVVADAVLSVVTSSSSEQALLKAGADPRYQVILSTEYGGPPIIQVTGIARTAQEAILSARLVTAAAETDLIQLQTAQGVNDRYLIKPTELVVPLQAQVSLSGKLRDLIAVLGLGAILLLIVVSVTDLTEKRRASKADATDLVVRGGPRTREVRRRPPGPEPAPYGHDRGSGRQHNDWPRSDSPIDRGSRLAPGNGP